MSMGGNPDNEEESKHLKLRSPLNYIDNIKKPFLLIHGDSDPTVAKSESESDQIFEAMKGKGQPPTYLSFPDEGHGVCKFHNLMIELATCEKFLLLIFNYYFTISYHYTKKGVKYETCK